MLPTASYELYVLVGCTKEIDNTEYIEIAKEAGYANRTTFRVDADHVYHFYNAESGEMFYGYCSEFKAGVGLFPQDTIEIMIPDSIYTVSFDAETGTDYKYRKLVNPEEGLLYKESRDEWKGYEMEIEPELGEVE